MCKVSPGSYDFMKVYGIECDRVLRLLKVKVSGASPWKTWLVSPPHHFSFFFGIY